MRWTHLSIHGRAFVGMDDENVFAMGTPVDSWWGFRRTGSFFFLWMHLSIRGGILVEMNENFDFAMDTPVDRFLFLSNHCEFYCLRLGWTAVNDRRYIVQDSFWMVYVVFSPR